jgi:hypothetical protein
MDLKYAPEEDYKIFQHVPTQPLTVREHQFFYGPQYCQCEPQAHTQIHQQTIIRGSDMHEA